ncbi:SagB/ThcOx family dehydrogenase [Streptomyces niveus]|uniref:SagB family peptide dehydrogenase n=1 Tax=Streptomyces niveus TaxID=193462 RepID=UPI003863E082|nr:SagB/ThcOx family dehydrogenase [Streptomyces niveus]
MDEDMLRCVTEQGFAARTLPLPLYVRAHAEVLVPAADAGERLDLRAADIPLLDVAVAADRRGALRQLVERAAVLRILRSGHGSLHDPRDPGGDARDDGPPAVGAGDSHDEAVARAIYQELACRRAESGIEKGTLITGRDQADGPGGVALRGVDGRIDCYLLGETAGVPAVGAVLRLDRLERPLCAVVCDLWERRGVERAVQAVLREFVVTTLPRREGTDRAPFPYGDFHDVVAVGETDFATLTPRPPRDGTGELRDRLRLHGHRASVRVLGPADRTALVACRLEPAAKSEATGNCEPSAESEPVKRPTTDTEDDWRPRDVATLGLRAPRQLSLTYERDDVRIGRVYHENSKMRTAYGTLPVVDIAEMSPPARRLLGQAYRDFGHARRQYPMRPAGEPRLLTLDQVVRRRRSWAAMGDGELTRAELAHLLTLSYGTTGAAVAGQDLRLPLRATPSAGGLYSSDLFVLVDRVTGVEPGLYYFHPGKRLLQLVDDERTLAEVAEYTGYRERAGEAAAMVVYVGAFRRNQWKYRERGYRTVLLDCGHLAQSVVTAATSLGLVAHPMIAFVDDYFNAYVGVDGVEDAVLYLTLLGPRRTGDEAA